MRKEIFFFIGLALIILFSIFYVLMNSIPENPISSRFKVFKLHRPYDKILVQGWGFFTRDPQEESVYFFKKTNEKLYEKINFDMITSYLNFNRNERKARSLLNMISQRIKDSLWINSKFYNVNRISFDEKSLKSIPVKVNTILPIGGTYYLARMKAKPWSWFSSNNQNIYMNSKIAKVRIDGISN